MKYIHDITGIVSANLRLLVVTFIPVRRSTGSSFTARPSTVVLQKARTWSGTDTLYGIGLSNRAFLPNKIRTQNSGFSDIR